MFVGNELYNKMLGNVHCTFKHTYKVALFEMYIGGWCGRKQNFHFTTKGTLLV